MYNVKQVKSSDGFMQLGLMLVIISGVFVLGGGIVFTTVYQKNMKQAVIAEKEKNEKAQILEKEKEELDKKINELQAQLLSVTTPSSSTAPVKDDSKNLEKLKKELEAIKKQKNIVVERIIVEKVKEEKRPEMSPSPSPLGALMTISPSASLTNGEIVKKIKPSVVHIAIGTEEKTKTKGSGFIIDSTGYILTNAHVLKIGPISVKLHDGTTFKTTTFSRDDKADIAILKINGNFTPVELGDSDMLELGDEVFAFGYPFGLTGDVSFKEGTFSRKVEDEGTKYLETSADIHPGNSGGPLVDKLGKVIGVNTAVYGRHIEGVIIGETIKLAIPVNAIKKLIADLKIAANASKKYTEIDLASYYEFNTGIEKNDETIKKGMSAYDKFANKLKESDLNDAQKYAEEAMASFASAKAEIKRLEGAYPRNLSSSALMRQIIELQTSQASNLYDAAEYGRSLTVGFTISDYGVLIDASEGMRKSTTQASIAAKKLIELRAEIEKQASLFFN